VGEFLFKLAFGLLLGLIVGLPAGAVAFMYELARARSLFDAAKMACHVVANVMDQVLEQL
jgi:hypothetical protein